MIRAAAVLACLALAACAEPTAADRADAVARAAYRAQQFNACMAQVPAGPVTTRYNDWSEVVGRCEDHAQSQMDIWTGRYR